MYYKVKCIVLGRGKLMIFLCEYSDLRDSVILLISDIVFKFLFEIIKFSSCDKNLFRYVKCS